MKTWTDVEVEEQLDFLGKDTYPLVMWRGENLNRVALLILAILIKRLREKGVL